ncbi:MAG: S41 family peptidase, partial [Verrucomicrobiota bacterium]
DTPNYTLFALDVNTLGLRKLAEDYATLNFANYSPDGKKVVYGRNGFHWTRPRYTGSAAAQIWMLSLETGQRQPLTENEFQHLWTRWMPDGKRLLTVTVGEKTPSSSRLEEEPCKIQDNPQRTPNLWLLDLEGTRQQLTTFTGGSVRCPTIAARSGDIAFEYEHDLWLLKSGKDKPQRIEIFASEDEKLNTRRREKLSTGVTEAEPSPDGKTFAFGLRGDIWTVAIDKPKGIAGRRAEIARRLTDWAGDDSDFIWSPDGKKLYFTSDREFNTRLYEVEIDTLKVKSLWDRPDDVTHPTLSPDQKYLTFWVSGFEGGLFIMDVDTHALRRVARAPGMHWYGMGGGDFRWSPDSRWIAYSRRGQNQAWNIWIVSIEEGSEPFNVTSLNAYHSNPAWSPDGKYLFFHSNRDGDGLYLLPLTKEPARVADADLKFEKPKEPVQIEIDFTGIGSRIRKVSSQVPRADLTVTSEGLIAFLSDGDVWTVSYDGKDIKRMTTDGGKSSLRISPDGKKAFYFRNGELYTMKLEEKGSHEKVSFTADWEQNLRAERQAAFSQFWRSYHRGFYDPNFHGRDWDAIRRRYEPLLESVETREEFATLLQMMVGELDASHSEVTAASGGPSSSVTPHLGFTFDYSYNGPGLKVHRVPPGAPGSYSRTAIHEGEFILEINGEEVALNEKLFRLINDKQDREFEFLVNSTPDREGARTVAYKILTQDEWKDLIYKNRIERLREYVKSRSEGKVGYLHIPSMGSSNQTQFEREAFEYVLGKDAMIIDVRFNNGGYIADTLIDWLDRKARGYVKPRDGEIRPSPARAWDRPLIVLINEHSFSNGEIFAYAARCRNLAKLVGMPTPGYVIWTDGLSLVDGTGARMPMSASYRLDGTPQENLGEQPDVRVPLTPDDWLAERDPQLDKAIEILLGENPTNVAEAVKEQKE